MIDQYNTLAEKFIRKGFWLYLFSFIIGPIGYITKIIISDQLAVNEVGILYGVISLMSLLIIFNDVGMSESLKHFIPKYITNNRYDKVKFIVFFSFGVQIITSIVISLFFFFGADFIATHYFKTEVAKEVLKIFAFYFVVLSIFQTVESFFISVQDTFAHKIIETLRTGFIMIYVIVVFALGQSSLINFSYGWILGLYLATFISLIVFYNKYYKKYLSTEKTLIKKEITLEVSKYAVMVFLGASTATILSQIDMQMIIYILGTHDAGYYTNYMSIINIPFLLIGPILAFLFPVFSELHSKGEIEKIKYIKKIFSKIFLIIGIMFNIFFFLFAEIIAYTLFGEKFIESGVILKYSIILLVFNYLLQINFNLMAGIGQVKERVKIISIAIVFNFIMNIILIKFLGVYGAALATGLGWVLIWIMSEIKLGKTYLSKIDFKPVLLNLGVFIVLGFILYKYFIWDFLHFTRIESFFMLIFYFFFWGIIFILINLKEFKMFYTELKKLKKTS